MNIKTSLQFNWLTFFILNNIAIILGLYLPFNFPYLKMKLRKLSITIFFVAICSTLISLIDIQQHGHKKYVCCQQIIIIFLTWSACKIIINRYKYFYCAERLYGKLSSIGKNNEKSGLQAKENVFGTLKKITKLSSIIMFVAVVSYSVHTKKSIHYYIIHEYIMFTILIFESFLLTETLEILNNNSRILRTDLKRIYKDFHKIPPADLEKSENGDLFLVGWITKTMDFSHRKEAVAELKDFFNTYCLLKECVDDFNVVFDSSVSGIILIFITKFLDMFWVILNRNYEEYETLLAAIFDWLYILVNSFILLWTLILEFLFR